MLERFCASLRSKIQVGITSPDLGVTLLEAVMNVKIVPKSVAPIWRNRCVACSSRILHTQRFVKDILPEVEEDFSSLVGAVGAVGATEAFMNPLEPNAEQKQGLANVVVKMYLSADGLVDDPTIPSEFKKEFMKTVTEVLLNPSTAHPKLSQLVENAPDKFSKKLCSLLQESFRETEVLLQEVPNESFYCLLLELHKVQIQSVVIQNDKKITQKESNDPLLWKTVQEVTRGKGSATADLIMNGILNRKLPVGSFANFGEFFQIVDDLIDVQEDLENHILTLPVMNWTRDKNIDLVIRRINELSPLVGKELAQNPPEWVLEAANKANIRWSASFQEKAATVLIKLCVNCLIWEAREIISDKYIILKAGIPVFVVNAIFHAIRFWNKVNKKSIPCKKQF